jgi:hypothetical protein
MRLIVFTVERCTVLELDISEIFLDNSNSTHNTRKLLQFEMPCTAPVPGLTPDQCSYARRQSILCLTVSEDADRRTWRGGGGGSNRPALPMPSTHERSCGQRAVRQLRKSQRRTHPRWGQISRGPNQRRRRAISPYWRDPDMRTGWPPIRMSGSLEKKTPMASAAHRSNKNFGDAAIMMFANGRRFHRKILYLNNTIGNKN